MNVLIIEDEKLTAQRLVHLLHRYDPEIRVLAQIPSVKNAINWFENTQHPKPDLLFLDIHLEDDLGFRIIEKLQLTIPVIFTTAYHEYTLRAFKVNSIDCLLKPVDFEELKAAIDKFKLLRQPLVPEVNLNAMLQLFGQNQVAYKDRFMVTVGAKLRSLQTSEIAYFSFEDRATILTTHDNLRLSVDYSLDKLTQLLNPHDFFRVNRSLLVSLSAIQVAHAYSGGKIKLELVPAFKQEVFVSGDRIADFKEWLGK
ncbi:MAG TPA: DNA-binding response regulator [Runella sp.]|nr:DNA-binding response regulator [Runella sp.]HAO48549.1 DNA-binding response regulator [Runella sp.]